MSNVILVGTVITGEGNGKRYLSLPWVKQQIEEKLGFAPYLGTLNLKLTRQSTQRKQLLLDAKSTVICPAEGYCVGILYKAEISELECAVIVPDVADYPKSLLEIISPLNLRDRLQLENGDPVEVTVYF